MLHQNQPTRRDVPLDLLRAKDAGTFARLAETHRRELEVHCYRMLGSLQDAEDVVQETLLRAWQRLETFTQPISFRAWLYKIATNVCLDVLAKRPGGVCPCWHIPPRMCARMCRA